MAVNTRQIALSLSLFEIPLVRCVICWGVMVKYTCSESRLSPLMGLVFRFSHLPISVSSFFSPFHFHIPHLSIIHLEYTFIYLMEST